MYSNVRLSLTLFVILTMLTVQVDPWRRRRRRRVPPPPFPQDCKLSDWGSWSYCSQICAVGHQTRHRTVVTEESHGGKQCDSLSESRQCGYPNGGCEHICTTSGHCQCRDGFKRQGNLCEDIDECNAKNAPCSGICVNSVGSYTCKKDSKQSSKKDSKGSSVKDILCGVLIPCGTCILAVCVLYLCKQYFKKPVGCTDRKT